MCPSDWARPNGVAEVGNWYMFGVVAAGTCTAEEELAKGLSVSSFWRFFKGEDDWFTKDLLDGVERAEENRSVMVFCCGC
ncbi:hypothetical protein KEM55_006715 [Ascosphaera atra]|nr:hypothetical protein KEM55_006715 [Ascosphaera atra]